MNNEHTEVVIRQHAKRLCLAGFTVEACMYPPFVAAMTTLCDHYDRVARDVQDNADDTAVVCVAPEDLRLIIASARTGIHLGAQAAQVHTNALRILPVPDEIHVPATGAATTPSTIGDTQQQARHDHGSF